MFCQLNTDHRNAMQYHAQINIFTVKDQEGGKMKHIEGWENTTVMHLFAPKVDTIHCKKCPKAKVHYSFKWEVWAPQLHLPKRRREEAQNKKCSTFRKKPLLTIYRKNERGKREKFQIYPNHPRLYLIHLIMVVGENPSKPKKWRTVFCILKNNFSPN